MGARVRDRAGAAGMREKGVDVAFLHPVLWPHLGLILLEVRQTCPSYLGMNPRQSVCVCVTPWRCFQPGRNDPRIGDSRVRTQAGVGDGERQRPRDTGMGKEIGTRDRNKTTEG